MPPRKSKKPVSDDAEYSLKALIEALTHPEDVASKRFPENVVDELAQSLERDDKLLPKLLSGVFENEIPLDTTFYERLFRITKVIGHLHAGASEVIGQIWAAAFVKIDQSNQKHLLRILPSTSISFFTILSAFPVVVKRIRMNPGFGIEYFSILKDRVGNDMVNGGLWLGIESWAIHWQEDAFDALSILLKNDFSDDKDIAVAAALMGALRVSLEGSPPSSKARKKIAQVKGDRNLMKRRIFQRSWINTCWLRGLEFSEFQACLDNASTGSQEELLEGMNFLRCVVSHKSLDSGALDYALKWLKENVTTSILDDSKYHVVVSIRGLLAREPTDPSTLRSILVQAMPVPADKIQIWTEIESLFSSLLEMGWENFEVWLFEILKADPKGVIEQLRFRGSFENLIHSIPEDKTRKLITDTLFSSNSYIREFAFSLFSENNIENLDEKVLSEASDSLIAISIYESRFHHLQAERMFQFFSAFIDRIESGSPQLVNFFKAELIYQAKNFPGAVLEGLKGLSSKSNLIKEVITKAEDYFGALKITRGTAINSMEIPGLQRALTFSGRRQSKEISVKSAEASLLQHLCSTSYLIYGNEGFRYCSDGEVGEVAMMQRTSVSMEMPRLWMIDPEGTAMRRTDAIEAVERISAQIAQDQVEPR